MSPIAGRLFALLLLDGGAVAFGDLADRLGVSRGSISTSARQLEQRGMIRRRKLPGTRQDVFELTENPYSDILDDIIRRAEVTRAGITCAVSQIGRKDHALADRLTRFASFYDALHIGAATALERLNGDDE